MLAFKHAYINNSKRLYSLFLEFLLANVISNPSEVKSKKECMKYLDSDSNIFNSFLLIALILVQMLTSLLQIERVAKETVNEY
jgi:hypothetical protein